VQRLERLLVIFTNLAVVFGLGLLVFELRQNRAAIELEYNMSVADIMSDTNIAIATDRSLAEALAKVEAGDSIALDSPDRLRVRYALSAMMEPRLSYYWMKDSDIIPHEDWCNVMRLAQQLGASAEGRAFLKDGASYAERMLADVDATCGRYTPRTP
jgi:hypothetical protein